MEFPETLPDRERTGRQEGEPSSVCHPGAGLGARASGPHRQCLTWNHCSAFLQITFRSISRPHYGKLASL